MRIFVYTNSPVFLIKKGEPGCLFKGKYHPKNRPFGMQLFDSQ